MKPNNNHKTAWSLVKSKQGLFHDTFYNIASIIDIRQTSIDTIKDPDRWNFGNPEMQNRAVTHFSNLIQTDWMELSEHVFRLYSVFSKPLLENNRFIDDDVVFDFARQIVVMMAETAEIYGCPDENYDLIYKDVGRKIGTLCKLYDTCESPLEQAFLIGIITRTPKFHEEYRWRRMLTWNELTTKEVFCCQYQYNRYRLDFAIFGDGFKINVEVDGHNYHEKTIEQAVRDRKRDRTLTADGWKVLRFHRAEIENGLRACIGELSDLHLECTDPGEAQKVRESRRKYEEYKRRRQQGVNLLKTLVDEENRKTTR